MIGHDDARKAMRFDEMEVGEEFDPVEHEISESQVREYATVFGDPHPWLRDSDSVAPPLLAMLKAARPIFARYKITPGTIHAKQEVTMIKPARPGENLTARSRVADKYEKRGKKYVVFETANENERGEKINVVRFHFILPG